MSSYTFSCESDEIDRGVTKFLPLFVSIVLILTFLFFQPLITSKLLYADIPPHMIRSIFLFFVKRIKIPIGLKLQEIISQ